MSLKRFALFEGDHYYPEGGWADFVSTHGTLQEAIDLAVPRYRPGYTWWHVVDLTTGQEMRHETRTVE